MEAVACREDLRRFESLSAELDALCGSGALGGALGALRASDKPPDVDSQQLCLHIRATCSASQNLVQILPLISQCCCARATQTIAVDLGVKIEGCEALQHVKAVLAANAADAQLPHLNAIVQALRCGVFTRLVDAESLAAGVDIFERFLTASGIAICSFTDCLCTLMNHSASSTAEGPAAVMGCVASWVEALVGLGSSVVDASKEAPNELRSGMVLTKAWKEIARLLQAIPADFRGALADSVTAAFSAAWRELQKCIRSLLDGAQEKHSLNEKLCRFWMQNCGKLVNEVPTCIAATGNQVWSTAHMLYAAVAAAPIICSPAGVPMAPEQRQLLLASLSQHLLPRIQVCAEQTLSYMPEASIQQNLQDLARCGPEDVDDCLLHGLVPEHAWPAAVAAGGIHFLAATIARSQQWPSLYAACARSHSFSSLCESLRSLPSVPGISQVSYTWAAQLAPHLSVCLLSTTDSIHSVPNGSVGAAQHEGGSAAVKWAAFTELCECSEYLPHAVAAFTVSWLCTAQHSTQPQCGAALSRMFWCAARRCAACMLEAQSCGMFARRFMDAVAACRCALVAAITDESGGAMQHLRQQCSPPSSSTPAILFHPDSCLAVSALLLAAGTDITGDSAHGAPQIPSQLHLLEDSVARQLTEHACSVLQWALECSGKQDTPVDTILQRNLIALLSLVIALTGGWSSASRNSNASNTCTQCISLRVCSATAHLCCEKQPHVSESLRATALLLLVVVCEAGCHSEDVPALLFRTLQHSLGSSENLFLACTHGLHARALAALSPFPAMASTAIVDASLTSPELTVTQCWQIIFTHALDACDSRTLAAILPWFAEYCTSCAQSDYTHGVPETLLSAKRTTGHGKEESLFLALLQRAQQVRKGYTGSSGDVSGQGGGSQDGAWVPNNETVPYTCLALSKLLTQWTLESQEAQCSVGGCLWRQVAPAVACELKVPNLEASRGAQQRVQFGGAGKENLGGAGNQAGRDWSDAAARNAALRDAVSMLRAVQQREQACNSSRAKGLLSVCSQLQALLGGE